MSDASPEELRGQIADLVERFGDTVFRKKEFVPGETPVPVSGKVIGSAELKMMVDAALDGWLTTGRFNSAFEKRLAEFVGVRYALTVNSGSSANLVAFSTLTSPKLGKRAIKKGDEVITVAAGFPTTINPSIQFGAVPVFVDIDLATHNIDTSQIEAALSDKTRAVMIAHSLGNPFDLGAVVDLCRKHDLWLIEDCCDALGATYRGQNVGTFGDLATLSFYPAHHITMGEGGAVLTNNPELKLIAESFRDWGRDCYCAPGADNTCNKRFGWKLGNLPFGYDHKYIYSHTGYNLKISDMQAACALAQMDRLPEFIAARRKNFRYLYDRLQSCSVFFHFPQATEGSNPSWFGFPLVMTDACEFTRVELLNYLTQAGIGTRLLFAGDVTRQPYMADVEYRKIGTLPNTEIVLNRTFWLGVYPGLDETMLDYVAQVIETFVGANF